MKDPRIEKLAQILINYSGEVKKGDFVLIDFSGTKALPLVKEIYRQALLKGAKRVEYNLYDPEISRVFYDIANKEQLSYFPKHKLDLMKKVDVYIGIGAGDNLMTFANADQKKMLLSQKINRKITDERVKNSRWVVTRYPSHGAAQEAKMSLEEFEDFYFNSCNIDWAKEAKKQQKLKKFMDKTKEVKIQASDTDLSFSIKGIPAITCCGKRNMPDGEVFTAPVKTSIEGFITYNVPTMWSGHVFNNIRFEFKKGKIVKATADANEKLLNEILNMDKGSRYIGEFALGLNKKINKPIMNSLFDEKIEGSIHLTPGNCYDECSNGNKSSLHWDLVKILKGDGELYFDGKLVQKNGKFVHPQLKGLN